MIPQLCILLAGLMIHQASQDLKGPRLSGDENQSTIYIGEQPVLSYVHSETFPPEGIDTIFKRSAYIHPLWSPGGARLTRIQPPDHWHHYGIWNPWARTHFGEHKVNFLNKTAVKLFEEGLSYFRLRELEKTSLVGYGNNCHILTWMGDKVGNFQASCRVHLPSFC